MFGGPDGLRRLMSQDQIRPQSVGRTLARFGGYFSRFVPTLSVVLVLVVISTWCQVLTPDLVGQAVDCYIAKRLKYPPKRARVRPTLCGRI